jgi:hypothetical protein
MITVDEIPDFLNPMPHLEILIYAKLFKSLISKKNAIYPVRQYPVYAIPVKSAVMATGVDDETYRGSFRRPQFIHNCV